MACCCELQNTLDVEVTQDALLDVEIGGSAGVLLQAKSVDITENGTSVVAPDDGFDGLKSVEINTNVPKRFECGDAYFAPPASVTTFTKIVRLLKTLNASCWDTSEVTSMSNLFSDCSSLQTLDVSGWDTSKVTNMDNMFYNCNSLQSVDVSGWNTSKVTTMNGMFPDCSSLQTLDVSGWDTSNVTDMFQLFDQCFSLQSVDVSGWDTSKVTNMSYVFRRCKKLQLLDLSSWNASNVMAMNRTFFECIYLKTIIGNKTLQDVKNGIVALRGLKLSISTGDSKLLRFSSILALANGIADLTGATAQTLTISAQSYNNMYNDDDTVPSEDVIAERQARIAAICAAKNWNFAH